MTSWLHTLAIVSPALAGASFVAIVLDLLGGHAQQMWIMNVVWPVTALYFGPLAVYAYFRWGRRSSQQAVKQAKDQAPDPPLPTSL
jgi:hypothetical protein